MIPSYAVRNRVFTPKYTTEEYIAIADMIHNGKYDYSKVIYTRGIDEITVICKTCGKEWQTKAGTHIRQPSADGKKRNTDCPYCAISKCLFVGEETLAVVLNKYNIPHKRQHTFEDCIHIRKLKFDFYLPERNMCIEYHGRQHYVPIDFIGGQTRFEEQKIRDEKKIKYCQANDIKLLIISYEDQLRIERIIVDYFQLEPIHGNRVLNTIVLEKVEEEPAWGIS